MYEGRMYRRWERNGGNNDGHGHSQLLLRVRLVYGIKSRVEEGGRVYGFQGGSWRQSTGRREMSPSQFREEEVDRRTPNIKKLEEHGTV
jgi:hypothetical protein